MVLLSDGQYLKESIGKDLVAKDEEFRNQETKEGSGENPIPQTSDRPTPSVEPLSIKRTRTVEKKKIKHYVVTGKEIIKEEDWDGSRVPIIIAKGKVFNIEGKEHIRGMVRFAKDGQRLYNWLQSNIAERIALTPKAQWIGTAKQFEGYDNDYADANIENMPFLKFKPDKDSTTPRPERVEAGEIPQSMFAEGEKIERMVENSLGGARQISAGDPTDQESGVLFKAKEHKSEVGVYTYINSMKEAIEETAEIVNDLMPKTYDTEREVYTRTESDEDRFVPINTTAKKAADTMMKNPNRYSREDFQKLQKLIQEKGENADWNNLNQGHYECTVTIGPSYTTQREEARNYMMQFASVSGKMNPVDKYFIAKNMDFAGAKEYVKTLKKTMPQGLIDPQPGEIPTQPPPPPPQMVLMMAKIEKEKLGAQVQLAKLKKEGVEIQKESNLTESRIKQIFLDMMYELNHPAGAHPADHLGNGNR
jgi:hypothetical protein